MTQPENQAEALAKLRKEYRPTMDAEVLHSWAADVVAALAALPEAPAAPVVKALAWKDIRGDGSLVAFPDIGLAYIASDKAWGHRNYPDQHPVDGGIEAAKAGAQADFEARIRSTLQSFPPVKTPAVDGEVPFDMLAHLDRQRKWSEATFGPGPRTNGVIDHIRKELAEIEADPADIAEWIDVTILALDGAWRAGHTSAQIIAALIAKQTKNEARNWPDWRTMSPDQAIEHVRDGAALASQAAGEGAVAPADAVHLPGCEHSRSPIWLCDCPRPVLRARPAAADAGIREGLSEWAGWDQSRHPWGETKHKDAVLEALFRGPWSVEDAAALIGFIDRTWTRRLSLAAKREPAE